MLERDIEKAVCEEAKKRGMLTKKIQTAMGGTVGWPDRLFITKTGKVFWVEFKRFGGKLSMAQKVVIDSLREHHQTVYVVDNVQYGKDILAGEDV